MSALPVLVACRLACSHVIGCYSFSKDPSNEYLLLHAGPAAEALEEWVSALAADGKTELEARLEHANDAATANGGPAL